MFNILITNPLANLLLTFYYFLGQNLGLAIIIFTIFLRIVLLPLTIKQIRLQKRMAELQPKLQEIQAKKKDTSQMTPEELKIMKQTASSCLGGCVPLLIQIPILIGLNTVIAKIASASSGDVFNNIVYFDFLKHFDKFNTQFLGIDLATVPSKIGVSNPKFLPFAIIIILLVITQFIQTKMMTSANKKKKINEEPQKRKANEKKVVTTEDEKEKMQQDMQKMMQMQTTYLIPLAIGMAAYSFTAALSIYWLTQNIFAIGQTYVQFHSDKRALPFLNKKSESKKEKNEKIREVEFIDATASETKKNNKKKKKKKK